MYSSDWNSISFIKKNFLKNELIKGLYFGWFNFSMDEENENWIFSDFEKKELSQDYIFTPFNEEDEKLG